jgi:hypothetical protein
MAGQSWSRGVVLHELPTDKRLFHRIFFDAPCEIQMGERVWASEVLDISLKGVLARRPEGWKAFPGQPCEITIHLDGDVSAIVMAVKLRHIETDRLGFVCQYIDLESASHLKRLVELNLADQAELERELSHMLAN